MMTRHRNGGGRALSPERPLMSEYSLLRVTADGRRARAAAVSKATFLGAPIFDGRAASSLHN